MKAQKPAPIEPLSLLQPDPIMQLEHIVGYNGSYRSNVKWTRRFSDLSQYPVEFTDGATKYLIYPAGNVLVYMNPVTRRQHFNLGHTAPISIITVSDNGSLVATGQSGPNPLVLVWDLPSGQLPSYISIAKVLKLTGLSISHHNNFLVTSGQVPHSKEQILIWDISQI